MRAAGCDPKTEQNKTKIKVHFQFILKCILYIIREDISNYIYSQEYHDLEAGVVAQCVKCLP